MTDNARAARAAAAEELWHDVALGALANGDVASATAAVYQYGADLDRINRHE